jgi:hypothetical protein
LRLHRRRFFGKADHMGCGTHAFVRQWAGQDEPPARRDKEIECLNRLVIDAIYALRSAGNDKEAARLDKKLRS